MGRRGVLIAVAGALVVAAVAVGGALAWRAHARAAEDDAASSAARALASAWSHGDLRAARFVGTPPATAQRDYARLVSGLGGADRVVHVVSTTRTGATATARLAVRWDVGRGWRYTTTAHLAPRSAADERGAWGARFSPSLVHPGLTGGQRLVASRTAAVRGAVEGRDGTAIVTPQPVVDVGVEPSRAPDPAGLAAQLGEVLHIDTSGLAAQITRAAPTAFVPVVTLRQSDYDAVAARIRPLPGTVFSRSTLPLAPTSAFARALLGRVGPATADIVEADHGRVAAGDTTGVSGLQRTMDARLAGTPATTVRVVDATGAAVRTLSTSPATPGQPVRLTLDPRTQEAADSALATATDATGATGGAADAALVAIDVPSGDVLAVANTPTSGADRALEGRYPPGSTFKTVTATALLAHGVTPEQVVDCPTTVTVSGRTFENFEGEAFGPVPFRTDFAQSCNTAFIGASSRLGPDDLRDTAASLGLGGGWGGTSGLGLDAFTGSVPAQRSPVDLAAASIGQGDVLVSPVAMAAEVAAVARGSWKAPVLVTDPAPSPSSSAGGAPAAPPDAGRLATVRDLMRSVVTSGTASALAPVPGAPVYAKTGTAEYGSASPPQVDAWTVGFQGDTAFAVVVEDGTSGAATAVPVAGAFLRALGGA